MSWDEIPLDTVTGFIDFPGNKAEGETAPDFSAQLLGGGTFGLRVIVKWMPFVALPVGAALLKSTVSGEIL